MVTWSLVVPTYNRRDVLLRALPLALNQTAPPEQVVVVDSSDDWTVTREAVQVLMADRPGIRLDYLRADTPSSATQRNQGIEAATAGIVVMIDDDTFLYPDFAERILAVYAADSREAVAAVGGRNLGVPPDAVSVAGIARKDGAEHAARLRDRMLRSHLGRWINRNILFQSLHTLFMKYEGVRPAVVPSGFEHLNVIPTAFITGHGLSVRRPIALAEPFDPALRFYAAFEDLDASYRYGRHGILLGCNDARLHHREVAGGRVKRRTATTFQLLNMLAFIKRNAPDPARWLPAYRTMLWRRLLGEAIKDTLSRRWDLPQTRGVMAALRSWRKVWNTPMAEIDRWYPDFQREIRARG